VRPALTILLLIPILIGTTCSGAMLKVMPAGDRGDRSISIGCCEQVPQGNDREEQGGSEDGTGACRTCCKVPAMTGVVTTMSWVLVPAGRPVAGMEQAVEQRRVDLLLRPPRFLS
jgi:hypothetical protein